MEKNAIITFDYEVYFGSKTGTIENSIIKPTQLILDVLKQNDAKAIFFVDATWLLFLQENLLNHFEIIVQQLQTIIKSGSSIELHLHPHWKDAYEKDGNIVFGSYSRYRIHSLGKIEMLALFTKSIELLESITNQKIRCFRAGGWCIEPFSELKDVFLASKIKYDFSVVPGEFLKEDKVYDYDFSKAPKLPFYSFQDDCCKSENKGCFVEFPVSTYNNNPLYRFVNKLMLLLKKDKIYGDGVGIQEKSYFFLRSLSRRLQFSYTGISTDKTSNSFFRFLLLTHFRKTRLLVIVSHPKVSSKGALQNLLYITKHYTTLNTVDLDKYLTTNS
jgi:hypothetical protein